LGHGNSCDFTLTGAWSKKAYSDALKVGNVNVLFDGKENNYMSLPDPAGIKVNEGSLYLHITSNETVQGTQWQSFPDTGSVPIIADMSSDIMSRSLPIEKFGVIYAGAQKNLGPSGVALVIIREDLLERCPDSLTAYLNYSIHASKNSLYNTPPVFPIYVINLVLNRLKESGGVEAAAEEAGKKSSILYDAINGSDGFYLCPVEESVRSKMNVVFRLSDENLQEEFLKEAYNEGFIGLKGHRSVGGLRASIYNAMPLKGVIALAQFMKNFSEEK
jgi:phosphoserine aminotransferase